MNDDEYQRQADILGPPAAGLRQVGRPRTKAEAQAAVERMFDMWRGDIAKMVAAHDLHQNGGCNAEGTLCSGAGLYDWLSFRLDADPNYGFGALVCAVGELSRARGEAERLRAELTEVQVRAMQIDVELADARGELADAEERLATAQAQLTACDEFPPDAAVWPEERSGARRTRRSWPRGGTSARRCGGSGRRSSRRGHAGWRWGR